MGDEVYDRDGDDLIRRLEVNFHDLILGTELKVDSLYGDVKVKIPKLSNPEQILKVSDFGVPNMSTHKKGDLFLILTPKFPDDISEEQIEFLESYRKSI